MLNKFFNYFDKKESDYKVSAKDYYNNFNGDKSRFLILSCGYSGSVWLASNLSLHDEIICSAGMDHPIGSTSFYHNNNYLKDFVSNKVESESFFRKLFEFGIILPGAESYSEPSNDKWVNNAYGFAKIAADKLNIELRSVIKERPSPYELIDILHKELEMIYPTKSVLGNIHACAAIDGFFEKNRKYFLDNNIIVLTLIANPILRFNAVVKRYYSNQNNFSIYENDEDYLFVKSEFGIDFLSPEDRAFFLAIKYNPFQYFVDEVACNEAPVIKFESIKKDRDHFAWLVNYLSGSKISVDNKFLDKIFNNETNYNNGRYANAKNYDTGLDYWLTLKDWQKYLLRKNINNLKCKEVFRPYGYDLSFI